MIAVPMNERENSPWLFSGLQHCSYSGQWNLTMHLKIERTFQVLVYSFVPSGVRWEPSSAVAMAPQVFVSLCEWRKIIAPTELNRRMTKRTFPARRGVEEAHARDDQALVQFQSGSLQESGLSRKASPVLCSLQSLAVYINSIHVSTAA